MMPDIKQFALNMLKNNPNFQNNPLAENCIQALETGDNQKGEDIANNLCQTYGISKEDAIKQAKKFFLIP